MILHQVEGFDALYGHEYGEGEIREELSRAHSVPQTRRGHAAFCCDRSWHVFAPSQVRSGVAGVEEGTAQYNAVQCNI